jgi:hypothetical protein
MSRVSRPHVLIVGSREYPDLEEVREFVRTLSADTIIVSGGAKGVDQAAAEEGRKLGMAVLELTAPWGCDGNAAGHVRNAWLVELIPEGGKVRAFWDGKSRGTKGTIELAKSRSLLDTRVRKSKGAPGNPWEKG